MKEIFCKENFFTDDEIDFLLESSNSIGPGNDYRNHEGPFANQLLGNYLHLTQDANLVDWLYNKISNTVESKFSIISATRVILYCPWDIHSDYHVNECRDGYKPYYNFLIPMSDYQSRTIIFDQYTDSSPHFSDYKNSHGPADNPPSEEFWQENLSMCWPQDRKYVSVSHILPWQRRGQLIGFPSKYFHSSDNFHTRFKEPKIFLQLRTESQ